MRKSARANCYGRYEVRRKKCKVPIGVAEGSEVGKGVDKRSKADT